MSARDAVARDPDADAEIAKRRGIARARERPRRLLRRGRRRRFLEDVDIQVDEREGGAAHQIADPGNTRITQIDRTRQQRISGNGDGDRSRRRDFFCSGRRRLAGAFKDKQRNHDNTKPASLRDFVFPCPSVRT